MDSYHQQPWRGSQHSLSHQDFRPSRYHSGQYSDSSSSDRSYPQSSKEQRSDRYPIHNYRRRRWPPQPSVEDEAHAILKEWPPRQPSSDEVPHRGKLDQEALLEQLISLDTRFVLVSDPSTKPSPKENKINIRKLRTRQQRKSDTESSTSELKIETDSSSTFEKRRPSPYSYTRTSRERVTSGDILQSPESLVPPNSVGLSRSVPNDDGFKSRKKSPRENSSLTSDSSAHKTDVSDDSDIDGMRYAKHVSQDPELNTPVTKSKIPGFDSRHPSLAGLGIGDVSRNKEPNLSDKFEDRSRRGELPSKRHARNGKEHPIKSNKALNEHAPQTFNHNDDYRRQPRLISTTGISSPTIMVGSDLRTPQEGKSLHVRSKPGTPQSPYEPFMFEAPQGPYSRLNDFNLPSHIKPNTDSRPGPKSQGYFEDLLGVPVVPHIDIQGPSPAQGSSLPYPDDDQNRGGSSLPYPVGDHPISMPNQFHFMNPDLRQSSSPAPSISSNKRDAPKNSRTSKTSKESRKTSSAQPVVSNSSSLSSDESNKSSKTNSQDSTPKLVACPRKIYSAGHQAWYHLEGASNFDVCPDCFNNMIKPTRFRDSFRYRPKSSSGPLRRCDFGKLWIRFAWLTVFNAQNKDLSLIYDLANINNTHKACPDNSQVSGTWYGLLDQRGVLVDDFYVCPQDKARIEALFPSLDGALAPIPSSRTSALCVMRSTSKRLPSYLDIFQHIHQSAIERYAKSASSSNSYSSKPSHRLSQHTDLMPLVNLAKSFSTQAPECPRDRATPNMTWHFVPDLPDLTVCPSCYADIILPDAKIGNALAISFTTVPRAVPPMAGQAPGIVHGIPDGHTCCLYSDRMRDVWDDAVTSNDPDGGIRRWIQQVSVRRRKEMELANRKVQLLRSVGSVRNEWFGDVDEKWIKRELEKVEDEWGKLQ